MESFRLLLSFTSEAITSIQCRGSAILSKVTTAIGLTEDEPALEEDPTASWDFSILNQMGNTVCVMLLVTLVFTILFSLNRSSSNKVIVPVSKSAGWRKNKITDHRQFFVGCYCACFCALAVVIVLSIAWEFVRIYQGEIAKRVATTEQVYKHDQCDSCKIFCNLCFID